MILSVEECRKLITTDAADEVLEGELQALELLIRKYTNNNFQQRNIRFQCPAMFQKLYLTTNLLSDGDTVQITDSMYCDGVYCVKNMEDGFIELDRPLIDEPCVLVIKVEYPMDVKMGVLNMLKWDLENRDKVGIQSETLSRHTVTYFDMGSNNSSMGFPKSLLGFLVPYRKARF